MNVDFQWISENSDLLADLNETSGDDKSCLIHPLSNMSTEFDGNQLK